MSCCGSHVQAPSQEREAGDPSQARVRFPWPLMRIGVAVLLASWGMVLGLAINTSEAEPRTRLAVHAALAAMAGLAFLLLGPPLLRDALAALRHGRLTIEALFLTALAAAGGFSVVSTIRGEGHVYYETVTVVLVIYSIGRELKARSQSAAMREIERIASGPLEAVRLAPCGHRERVAPAALVAGDTIEVPAGEEIPVDGVIVGGAAFVREAAVTGEWQPVAKRSGDRVLAGTHPTDGSLRLRVTRPLGERSLDRSLATVGRDIASRAAVVRRSDALLRWFIPIVWAASLATFAGWAFAAGPGEAAMHALAVLLVACPCALGFATPAGVWAAGARLSRLGLTVRDADFIEQAARVDTIAIDKTGTITAEEAELGDVVFDDAGAFSRGEITGLIAAVEAHSRHPFAAPLRSMHAGDVHGSVIEGRVLPGVGLEAAIELEGRTHTVWIGRASAAPLEDPHALESLQESIVSGTGEMVAVVIDGRACCVASLVEAENDAWPAVANSLRQRGVRIALLSGDGSERVDRIDADERHASLRPEDKRRFIAERRDSGARVMFIGDGALLAASVAHASMPRDAAVRLPEALDVARLADVTLRQNLTIAAAYNTIGMGVAAAGLLHPVFAAVVMIASSVTVTTRAMSIAEEKRDRQGPKPDGSRRAAADDPEPPVVPSGPADRRAPAFPR